MHFVSLVLLPPSVRRLQAMFGMCAASCHDLSVFVSGRHSTIHRMYFPPAPALPKQDGCSLQDMQRRLKSPRCLKTSPQPSHRSHLNSRQKNNNTEMCLLSVFFFAFAVPFFLPRPPPWRIGTSPWPPAPQQPGGGTWQLGNLAAWQVEDWGGGW